jgi:hypothetical protein
MSLPLVRMLFRRRFCAGLKDFTLCFCVFDRGRLGLSKRSEGGDDHLLDQHSHDRSQTNRHSVSTVLFYNSALHGCTSKWPVIYFMGYFA